MAADLAADLKKYGYGYDPAVHYEYGYGRIDEFDQDRQRGFVQHKRHVFLCYGSSGSWPKRFVADSFPGKLLAAFKSRRRRRGSIIKTIITVCEASHEAGVKEGDVLIFPDMVKYSGLTTSLANAFVKDVLTKEKFGPTWTMEPMEEGSYVFVCAHDAHDRRSGVCGQLVMTKLKEIAKINGIQELLFPIPCSDIGVPEYAANIIIFSRGFLGEVDGHWYTYVCPIEVCALLYYHIVRGDVYRRRWRGKLGNERPLQIPQYPFSWWRRGPDTTIGGFALRAGIEMVGWGKTQTPKAIEGKPLSLPPTKPMPLHLTSEEKEAYRRNPQLMMISECEDEGKMPIRSRNSWVCYQ